jgi:hypothetical protein
MRLDMSRGCSGRILPSKPSKSLLALFGAKLRRGRVACRSRPTRALFSASWCCPVARVQMSAAGGFLVTLIADVISQLDIHRPSPGGWSTATADHLGRRLLLNRNDFLLNRNAFGDRALVRADDRFPRLPQSVSSSHAGERATRHPRLISRTRFSADNGRARGRPGFLRRVVLAL